MTQPVPSIRRRVVILGASNVSRSIGTLVGLCRAIHPGPLEMLIAAGHGRSYGTWSSVLGRSLPGIRSCDLWGTLEPGRGASTAALLTDIGNDLLYEQPPEQMAGWIEDCLTRLAACGARTVLTELPLANLERLSPARFLFFRTLFVPRCRLGQLELSARAQRLNELVQRLASSFDVPVVAPRREWYGLDPIHIRYRCARRAWHAVLSAWKSASIGATIKRGSLGDALYLRTRLPAERRFGWITQRRDQPAVRWKDGTTIAFY